MRVLSILVLFTTNLMAASHHPQTFLASIAGTPQEGQQIVQHFCASCHAPHPLIPLGAPRMGVIKDWDARLKQGTTTFMQHTDEGIGLMPPRGGCFECTDHQLLLAIQHMLSAN